MKLKEYLNSLVSRRKSTSTPKPHKTKSHQQHHHSVSSTDCHYDISGYEDVNKAPTDSRPSRTQVLLTRHAQLVNTIIGMRSQENLCSTCPQCRVLHQPQEHNITLNRNYSNTLATCHPHRECQYPASTLSSDHSHRTQTQTKQRTKIRTNPWIKSIAPSHVDYSNYEPTSSSSTLVHSESFPLAVSSGIVPSTNPLNVFLHQSDSGHGFSLSSSKAIDSSSPDNTSTDGLFIDENVHYSHMNNLEQRASSRKLTNSIQPHYQRSSNKKRSLSPMRSTNRHVHKRNDSPVRVSNDHFSIEFEEILENGYAHKQSHSQSSMPKSPFILPLDDVDIKRPMFYSTTMTKMRRSNSPNLLQNIDDVENELQMIKNFNLNDDQNSHSSTLYSNEDEKQSIHEQVDQWVDQCLSLTEDNPTNLLHTECDHLSNAIKDYVVCVCSEDNQETSTSSKSQGNNELMTAFYVTSVPTMKRTCSLTKQLSSTTIVSDLKFLHECPF